jgi:hypothetical protein
MFTEDHHFLQQWLPPFPLRVEDKGFASISLQREEQIP